VRKESAVIGRVPIKLSLLLNPGNCFVLRGANKVMRWLNENSLVGRQEAMDSSVANKGRLCLTVKEPGVQSGSFCCQTCPLLEGAEDAVMARRVLQVACGALCVERTLRKPCRMDDWACAASAWMNQMLPRLSCATALGKMTPAT